METELKSLRIDRTQKRSRETRKISRPVIGAVIAIVLLAGAYAAYRNATAAVLVQTVDVQSPTASAGAAAGEQTVLSSTGYIIAAHKIEVASKVNGRVLSINVDKGDHVQAGQILVRLESDEYQAQLLQQQGQLANLEARLAQAQHGSRPEEIAKARADVGQSKADLDNARVSLDRTQQLVKDGVLSKQTLDDAQAKYDANVAKVTSLQRTLDLSVLGPRSEEVDQIRGLITQAKGALAFAQTQMDNTVIRAPITGTILDRNVEKGEFITTGFVGDKGAKGYIVTMADLNDLQVELDISQSDFPKLSPAGQKGTVTTDAYPDRKYEGIVQQVSPEADRAKATVQVKVKILNPDGYLRPDMNATVAFFNDQPRGSSSVGSPAVTIPQNAVADGHVFVVLNGRAIKRDVSTGATAGSNVYVTKGLIGGEELIVSPPSDLKDNQRVSKKQ